MAIETIDWMEDGACKDMGSGIMFPSDSAGVTVAIEICAPCTVRDECLEYALRTNQTHGVWGGTSERERVQIKKSRKNDILAQIAING